MCCYAITRVFLRLSANRERALTSWGQASKIGAALREWDPEQDEHGFLDVLLAL